LLEKILGVTDLHVANLNYSTASPTSICADELELFSVCLLRLTNVGSALSLRLYNQGIIEADRVHTRFESLRKGVLNDATSQAVRNETLSFFKHIIPVDTSGKYSTHLLTWLGEIIRRSDDYSVEAINAVLTAMLPVLKTQAAQACQVRQIPAQYFTRNRAGIIQCFLSQIFFFLHRLDWMQSFLSCWTGCAAAPRSPTLVPTVVSKPGAVACSMRMWARS
jgi:hypothetical protein